MLCGYTPFWDGGSPMKIYENILRGRVKYPAYIHPDAQDLLQQLITPDLTKRLGEHPPFSATSPQLMWQATCTMAPSRFLSTPGSPRSTGRDSLGSRSNRLTFPRSVAVLGTQ